MTGHAAYSRLHLVAAAQEALMEEVDAEDLDY